jgi:ABC-2 type transport system permease protein
VSGASAKAIVELFALMGVQATVLALLAFIVVRAGRLRPGWQAAVWLVVLAKFVLPWGPALPWSLADLFAALRTGSGEAVQGLFPVFFVFLFLSSQALPRPLIEQDWFRTIATWNPVSYMLEGIRSVVITGWDRVALERGFAVAIVLCVVGIFGASRALRTRLVRT